MTAQLPEGWEWATVGELCKVQYGKGLSKERRVETGEVEVYGSAGLTGHHDCAVVQEPVIVVGRKGNAGRVWLTNGPSWPIDTTYFLQLPGELSIEYVALQLGNLDLVHMDSSTTIPSLRRPDLEVTTIAIAPFSEQRRIVERIEEIISRLDAVESTLISLLDKLGVLRSAILADAFHPNRDLPPDWKWNELGSVAKTQLGKTLSKDARRGIRPRCYLRNVNVRWHSFDLHDIATMDFTESESRKYELRPGDLLVCEGGEVGRCATWQLPASGLHFQNALHRVRPHDGLSGKWIEYFLHWSAETGRLQKQTSGVTLAHLTQGRLRKIRIPIPRLAEQKRIIIAIEERFSSLNMVKVSLRGKLDQVAILRQSVLTEAFAGRLVPQDPDDEPALALLERIAASRPAKPRRRKVRA